MNSYDYLCPVGRVYVAPYGGGKLHELGEVSDLKLEIDSETKELANHRTESRGVEAMIQRTKAVKISMTIHDFNYENASFLLSGLGKKLPSAPIVEIFDAFLDSPIMLENLTDGNITITTLDGATTYNLGNDFNLIGNVVVLKSSGSITSGEKIKVSYTSIESRKIAALLLRSSEFKVFFDGLNEYNGKSIKVEIHRVRFTPSKEIQLITEDFNKFSISGTVMRESKNFDAANPESEFFNIIQEN